MRANIDNIYKNMKSEELALIAFKSISTQNEELLDTIEANVVHKTFVGRDHRYTLNVENRVNFAVWFGLQYHNLSALMYAHKWLYEREESEAGKRVLNADADYKLFKMNILLGMANRLCDEYNVDKTTFLGLSQIPIKPDELEVTEEPNDKYFDEELMKYKSDMEGIFVAVLTRK